MAYFSLTYGLQHYAAEGGYANIIDMLLKEGADPKALTTYKSTPLHWACEGGHIDAVRLLCRKGDADLEARDQENSTPLHLAAEKGYHKLVLVLVKEFGGKMDDRAKKAMLTVAEQPSPAAPP